MGPKEIIASIQLALTIITYGRKLIEELIDCYYAIEKKIKEKGRSQQKAKEWNQAAAQAYFEKKGVVPTKEKLASLRNTVWKTRPENKGVKPKPINENALPEPTVIV